MIQGAVLALMAAALAAWLTGLTLRYAQQRSLLDHPNERSSHSLPTPRGGGLAVAVVVCAALPLLPVLTGLPWVTALCMIGAGGSIAAIGWLDDRRGVAPGLRLLIHLGAAALVLIGTKSLGPLAFPGLGASPVLQFAFGALAITWLVNLCNFMDGIDGLAGMEAVFAAWGLSLCLHVSGGGDGPAAVFAWLLGGAALGFLTWNWPPARIFMGDVGSGFLGFALATAALLAARAGQVTVWVPVILLALFVSDATLTLLRRALRGERWYSAHRTHAYQWLARKHGSHRAVTIAALGINLLWLLPLALAASCLPERGAILAATAYAPLVVLAFAAGAGRSETSG